MIRFRVVGLVLQENPGQDLSELAEDQGGGSVHQDEQGVDPPEDKSDPLMPLAKIANIS